MVISRLLDTIFAFPAVLLGIGVVALLGTGIANVVVAVAIISVPTLGRLTRVAVLSQRSEEYVQAARALGASGTRVVTRHILQNVVPPLLVQTALVMADAVLLEAGFSFLGLGSRPPTPSWGTMLDSGRRLLEPGAVARHFPGSRGDADDPGSKRAGRCPPCRPQPAPGVTPGDHPDSPSRQARSRTGRVGHSDRGRQSYSPLSDGDVRADPSARQVATWALRPARRSTQKPRKR